jgi:hypothetical protein
VMRSKGVKVSIPATPPAAPAPLVDSPRPASPLPRAFDARGGEFALDLEVSSSSRPQPELVLAPQALVASSGCFTSGEDQFQGVPSPCDVLLAGMGRPSLWSSAADEDKDDAEEE